MSRRRTQLFIALTICFIFWRAFKSAQEAGRLDAELTNPAVSSRSVPRSLAQNEIPTRGAKHPAVVEDIVSDSQLREVEDKLIKRIAETKEQLLLERSVIGQAQASKQVVASTSKAQDLVDGAAADHTSENATPDEPDDGTESDLKGLAVAITGKQPPLMIKNSEYKSSEDGQQQRTTPAIKDDEKERAKSRKLKHKELPSEIHKRTSFPKYEEFVALDSQADTLPDLVVLPFEDSTEDVILQGWEDEWFSEAKFDTSKWGNLQEPKIDFIYTWVNGSEKAFTDTIIPYELNSTLNDLEGKWLQSHRVNRYRDWDELRYSVRTVEKHAQKFRNKIQILVNSVGPEGLAALATPEEPSVIVGKQQPLWLNKSPETKQVVEILSQEDFFDEAEQGCLPSFNSLTIENQIYNTPSDVDRFFAMSDDMFLGKEHSASDIFSPLFGPTMGFKTNAYNTKEPPSDLDARRFGEKPYLIYTSWLLNRRFGERKRKGQVHFGHSMSRAVTKEAIRSFPRPALQSNCQRFRGETGFQLYSWYVAFHFTIERQREALLWSYIMLRTDANRDGNLGWSERQAIMSDLEEGMQNEGNTTFRKRQYYQVSDHLERAGLEAPKVNLDVLWTSLDGPAAIRDIECYEFNVNECMAPGFSVHTSDEYHINPVFSTASVLDRVARQHPKCGDCLIKLLLNRAEQGFNPILPHQDTQGNAREIVIKALLKYQYSIVEPDAMFVMVTDAEQVKNVLLKRLVYGKREVGQLCLNDDVAAVDEESIKSLRKNMLKLFKGLVPKRSRFERGYDPKKDSETVDTVASDAKLSGGETEKAE